MVAPSLTSFKSLPKYYPSILFKSMLLPPHLLLPPLYLLLCRLHSKSQSDVLCILLPFLVDYLPPQLEYKLHKSMDLCLLPTKLLLIPDLAFHNGSRLQHPDLYSFSSVGLGVTRKLRKLVIPPVF